MKISSKYGIPMENWIINGKSNDNQLKFNDTLTQIISEELYMEGSKVVGTIKGLSVTDYL